MSSPAYDRIKAEVLAIASRIPPGRVSTHGQIGTHLKVFSRHIAHLVTALDERDRAATPWWRVVADGGAVGRHRHRDEQIQRLKHDGVVVSPAGIVQDLQSRLMKNLSAPLPGAPLPGASTRPENQAPVKPRIRGMRAKPQSSL